MKVNLIPQQDGVQDLQLEAETADENALLELLGQEAKFRISVVTYAEPEPEVLDNSYPAVIGRLRAALKRAMDYIVDPSARIPSMFEDDLLKVYNQTALYEQPTGDGNEPEVPTGEVEP